MVAQEPVKAAVWHSLNSYCFTDAIFLAERLYAEVGTEECLHLLATCYHRAGHTKRTYNLLKKNTHVSIQSKYLFAVVCYTLKKYSEAEIALTGHWTQWNKMLQSIGTEFGSMAGVTFQLLGNIYRKSDLITKAGECYKQSLKYNPFLWGSFEALCQIGEKIDPLDYFKTSNSVKIPTQQIPYKFHSPECLSPGYVISQYDSSENLDPSKAIPLLTSTVISKPEHNTNISSKLQREDSLDLAMPPPQTKPIRSIAKARQRLIGSKVSDSPLTPSFGVLPADSPIPVDLGNSPLFITPPVSNLGNGNQLKAPMKVKKTNVKSNETSITRKSSFNHSSTSSLASPNPNRDSPSSDAENYIVPNLRRSSRLFGTQAKESKRTPRVHFADVKGGQTATRRTKSRINKTNSTQPLTPTTQNIIQASTKMSQMNTKKSLSIKDEKPVNLPSPIQQSTNGLMKLLQEIGKAYHALSLYDCKKAVNLFEELPLHQQETCWVMDKIAISYFELGEMDLGKGDD